MNNPADFVFTRSYRGKVQAVVLDWSGTTADAYVIAPAVVFVEVFKNQGVEISMLEARGPMGLRKDLHIKMLTEDPVIRARWKSIKWQYTTDEAVANMFEEFVPAQVACLPQYTTLLPGIAEYHRAYEAHRVATDVHDAADSTNTLSTPDALMALHVAYMTALASTTPDSPTDNPGLVTLTHAAGMTES